MWAIREVLQSIHAVAADPDSIHQRGWQIERKQTKRGRTPIHEIICPHCHKAFKIDEAGYADILKQVRDGDFEKQLNERLELAEREKRGAIALAEANVTNALQKTAAAKDTEIKALKAQLDADAVAHKLAVTEALGTVSKNAISWRMS